MIFSVSVKLVAWRDSRSSELVFREAKTCSHLTSPKICVWGLINNCDGFIYCIYGFMVVKVGRSFLIVCHETLSEAKNQLTYASIREA